VLTKEVYDKVKDEIPKHIGAFVNGCFYKKPIKQKLDIPVDVLKDSMIRSLCRESDKLFLNSSKKELEKTKRALEKEKQEIKKLKKEIANLKKGAK
jgi:predicted translin family RNA/ssDNA-binding protein